MTNSIPARTEASIKDSVAVISKGKTAAVAARMGFAVKDVRMDAKTLITILTLREDAEREYEILKERYAAIGIEKLLGTISILKKQSSEEVVEAMYS